MISERNASGGHLIYAIAFELMTDVLKEEYGEPYNKAYDEIRHKLETVGFEWTQSSVYINSAAENSLAAIYSAITRLSSISWFVNYSALKDRASSKHWKTFSQWTTTISSRSRSPIGDSVCKSHSF